MGNNSAKIPVVQSLHDKFNLVVSYPKIESRDTSSHDVVASCKYYYYPESNTYDFSRCSIMLKTLPPQFNNIHAKIASTYLDEFKKNPEPYLLNKLHGVAFLHKDNEIQFLNCDPESNRLALLELTDTRINLFFN